MTLDQFFLTKVKYLKRHAMITQARQGCAHRGDKGCVNIIIHHKVNCHDYNKNVYFSFL